jgi:CRP-like cAMP-binding protein
MLIEVAFNIKFKEFSKGEVIFKQGAECKKAFLITHGSFLIRHDDLDLFVIG